jgi:hypothetical protein
LHFLKNYNRTQNLQNFAINTKSPAKAGLIIVSLNLRLV